MGKKIISIFLMLVLVICTFASVNAESMTDKALFSIGAYEDIYKLSEQEENIDLPFFNAFLGSAVYDKAIHHSGISFGQSTIEVGEKLEGVQLIFTQDMVTIKGEVENGIIYGNNIVVEGTISDDTILMAPQVQIMENAKVSGDLIVIANSLDVKGTISGNLIATVSESTKISGTIEDDLRLITSGITLEGSSIKDKVYIETDSDVSSIKELYPNATIVELQVADETQDLDVLGIVTKGIITVVVYTFVCFLITKKENNIAVKLTNKFKEKTTTAILLSLVMLIGVIFIPFILIYIIVLGIGVIGWPLLIVYIALLLFVLSTSSFVVGSAIYVSVESKVEKWKIPAMALIFALVYALIEIPVISFYAIVAINLIALAIILTTFMKNKVIVEVKENIKAEDNNEEK